MTQEDKQLLLTDLCARLPYEVKVFYEYVDDLDNKTYGYSLTLNTWCIDEFNADKAVVKPYLRPMSSMTEEEKKEFENSGCIVWDNETDETPYNIRKLCSYDKCINWLFKNHFDFRGLIPKGLALEASEGMYNED